MKARIPLSCAQRKRMHDEMLREYQNVATQERDDMTRRICKTLLYVLNTEFGFGVKRCAKLFAAFTKKNRRIGQR